MIHIFLKNPQDSIVIQTFSMGIYNRRKEISYLQNSLKCLPLNLNWRETDFGVELP